MTKLTREFEATLQKSPAKGGWTYVVMPDSAEFFGTRGWSRSAGRSTDTTSAARSWRWATARTSLPVKADVRKAIGKEKGDAVIVQLEERLG